MVKFFSHQQINLVLLSFMAVAILMGACQLPVSSTGQAELAPVAEFAPVLTDLNDLSELQAVFNAYSDMPRLILLLSPT